MARSVPPSRWTAALAALVRSAEQASAGDAQHALHEGNAGVKVMGVQYDRAVAGNDQIVVPLDIVVDRQVDGDARAAGSQDQRVAQVLSDGKITAARVREVVHGQRSAAVEDAIGRQDVIVQIQERGRGIAVPQGIDGAAGRQLPAAVHRVVARALEVVLQPGSGLAAMLAAVTPLTP